MHILDLALLLNHELHQNLMSTAVLQSTLVKVSVMFQFEEDCSSAVEIMGCMQPHSQALAEEESESSPL